jgi:hypothetical protein
VGTTAKSDVRGRLRLTNEYICWEGEREELRGGGGAAAEG